MNGKVTYHQQVSYCGKPRCRKCREGIGHGPYWYAYQTIDGQTTRTYIGKHLPPGAEVAMESSPMNMMESTGLDDPGFGTGVAGMLPLASTPDNVLLRISTLGQFRLERRSDEQWQTITDSNWQQPEVRTLLGFLLSNPERSASSAQVLQALWPNTEDAVTKPRLKRVLHSLRQVLNVVPQENNAPDLADVDPDDLTPLPPPPRRSPRRSSSNTFSLLRTDDDRITLADQSLVWVDASAFEHLLARIRASQEHNEEQQALYEEAVSLYGGDYLPEERHTAWAVTRRQALRRSWSGLLLDLADLRLQRGSFLLAVAILDRLLASDPANEAAVQRLIVALVRQQRRGEALRAYHRLVDVLQRDYQAEPSEETRALFEAVRRGEDIPLVGRRTPRTPTVEQHEDERAEQSLQQVEAPSQPLPKLVTQEAPAQPAPIGRTHQSPLVGREHELEVLADMLLDVEQSARAPLVALRRTTGIPMHTQRRPQTVFLMGEAGIGKTRLAEEVSRQAQGRGWSIMWSRIYAQESAIPYRLWTEALRKAISQSAWRWQEVGKHPTVYQPLAAILPELGSMLPRRTPVLTPEQEQVRLWEATLALLITLSQSSPLLIVLDDVQWADFSSCALLAHLARNVQGHPILLVCTCRENEIAAHPLRDFIAHMQREHTVTTLSVDPLTGEQIARLVSHLPEPMVQHIKDQAAGNPFFAEELARTTPPAVPNSVAAALDSRISRLSTACQQLLGNAAVLGGAFDLPVIFAMEASGTLADEDTVLDLLEEAQRAGVLAEEGTGSRISYHFWHPMLVSHLYERVSGARRLRLHRRAATILQRTYQKREEEVAATIAHHLEQGGADPLTIAHYAELAGDRAYTLSAHSEAERYYRLAVEQLEQPAGVETQIAEETNDRQDTRDLPTRLAYLLERLAECNMILGRFPAARKFYERLLEMHRQRTTVASAIERQEEALLWGELARTWRFSELARARECCERGEAVLREAGIVGGPAWAGLRYLQSALYLQEGRFNEGYQAAQEALTLFEQQAKPESEVEQTLNTKTTRVQRTLNGDPIDLGRTHVSLGMLDDSLGQRTRALHHLNTALAIYEQYDYKRGIAHVTCDIGYIHLKRGEHDQARVSLRQALNLAERVDDAPLTSVIFSNMAGLAADTGEFEEAETLYRRSLSLAASINDREYMSRWNAALADVLREQGKYDEAAACIVRALLIGRAMRNAPCTGLALVALGRLRMAQASAPDKLPSVRTRLLARAREDLQRALDLKGLEAETRTHGQLALAQLLLLLGDTAQARTLANKVIEEARSHELPLVEEKARRIV